MPAADERGARVVADARCLSGREHEIAALSRGGHRRHRGDVIRRVAEIAARIEIAERDRFLAPERDARRADAELARDERRIAPFRFVIEQDRARSAKAMRCAPARDRAVREQLRQAIRRDRRQRRRFVLRSLAGRAEDFGARGEHEMRVGLVRAHRFEHMHGADAVRFDAADRIGERRGDAGLSGEMENRRPARGGRPPPARFARRADRARVTQARRDRRCRVREDARNRCRWPGRCVPTTPMPARSSCAASNAPSWPLMPVISARRYGGFIVASPESCARRRARFDSRTMSNVPRPPANAAASGMPSIAATRRPARSGIRRRRRSLRSRRPEAPARRVARSNRCRIEPPSRDRLRSRRPQAREAAALHRPSRKIRRTRQSSTRRSYE